MYFYVQDLNRSLISGYNAEHLFSCRVKPGDKLNFSDFKGNLAIAEIVIVDKKTKSIRYKTLEKNNFGRPEVENVLFQAIPDKQYLEKLCEVIPLANIHKLVLFHSDYSLNYNINLERLQKIIIRSSEQGERLFLPEIEILKAKDELLNLIEQHKPLVLHTQDTKSKNIEKDHSSILVGPEGGWSQEEINRFKNLNLDFVNLGQTIYPAWLAGYSWFIKNSI